MFRFFTLLFTSLLALSSCKNGNSQSSATSGESTEETYREEIIAKVKQLQSMQQFSVNDVKQRFPNATIKTGIWSDTCRLDDSFTLYLSPGSGYSIFGMTIGPPVPFETRDQGVILEIEDPNEDFSEKEYAPPELPSRIIVKGDDKGRQDYTSLSLMKNAQEIILK